MFNTLQTAIDKSILFFNNCQKLFDGTYYRDFVAWFPGFMDEVGYSTALIGIFLCIILKVLGYEDANKWIALILVFWLLTVLL